MNIDRNNYEMFFLLYVDNELSAEERIDVEKFVAENIDLRLELELLLQTALPSEEIIFTAKNNLYKNEQAPDHLQEQMLLHLDNELESLPLGLLTAEIAANDDLKREWNILQQTRLDPNEKFIFENKQLLYRYEKDKLVSMRFWRTVAAIFILGVTIFIGVLKFSGDKSQKDIATGNNTSQPPVIKESHIIPVNIPGNKNNSNQLQPAENTASTQPNMAGNPDSNNGIHSGQRYNNLSVTQPKDKNNSPVKNNIIIPVEKKNDREKTLVKKETNNLPIPYFENINNQAGNKTASSPVQDNIKTLQNKNEDVMKPEEKIIAQGTVKESKITIEDISLTETHNSFAKNTMMDDGASEKDNNSILFINEEKVNRTKISGLFRKVKRVLSRNANIGTGNSVKIAGFEIATR